MTTKELFGWLTLCSDSTRSCGDCRYYNYGIGSCVGQLLSDAAKHIEQLQKELDDERYRHDRLQDWSVAVGKELEAAKRDLYHHCQTCKHMVDVPTHCKDCWKLTPNGSNLSKWEWRGVTECD